MEKNKELLTKIAIISDNIEKLPLTPKSVTVTLNLSETEYDKVFQTIQSSYNNKLVKPKNSFNITIGGVDFVINMSNV